VLDAAAFTAAIRSLVPPAAGRGRRGATLILPDNSVRITVLDFDRLPENCTWLTGGHLFRVSYLRNSVTLTVIQAVPRLG